MLRNTRIIVKLEKVKVFFIITDLLTIFIFNSERKTYFSLKFMTLLHFIMLG